MYNLKNLFIYSNLIACFVLFYSCGDSNPVSKNSEILIYEESGLVDSAVVTGCYAYTRSHFLNDTFTFNAFRKLRIEFDGYSTSDHAAISVLINNNIITNEVLYSKNNSEVNRLHSFEIESPSDTSWLELRLYMNPQVCGENEFKYIRARDLKITGLN